MFTHISLSCVGWTKTRRTCKGDINASSEYKLDIKWKDKGLQADRFRFAGLRGWKINQSHSFIEADSTIRLWINAKTALQKSCFFSNFKFMFSYSDHRPSFLYIRASFLSIWRRMRVFFKILLCIFLCCGRNYMHINFTIALFFIYC